MSAEPDASTTPAPTPESHPAAADWRLMDEQELRRLADDIGENGLRHPIVLDSEGLVLDGRNRLAACDLAGVEPTFETYEGDDPEGYVLSANNERRHATLPERAASVALTLGRAGKRVDGKNGKRWEYGAVSETAPSESTGSGNSRSWTNRMREAGLVLDYLGEARLRRVAEGKSALDAEVKAAKKVREEQSRISDLPEDLRVLVEADELSVVDAERRAKLSDRYAALVASGDLDLDEAEHLNERDLQEHEDALQGMIDTIETLVACWPIVKSMRKSPLRDEVLRKLDTHDRDGFLAIERTVVNAGPMESTPPAEDECVDCGAPVEPDPTFEVLRCFPCATKAGKESAS